MKRQLAFGIFILTLATLACRVSLTPTPSPKPPPSITPTITLTPLPTQTETPIPTSTPPRTASNGPALLELHMYAPAFGWGLTENQILITRDGGVNWAQVPLPGVTVDSSVSAYFISPEIAYFFVPGTNNQPGQIFATRDSGGTWQTASTPFTDAKIYFANDNVGFAMQTLSTVDDLMTVAIYQSLDRSATWTQVFIHTANQSDANLPVAGIKTGLSFIDASQGFIGLRAQTNNIGLYHAEDAGRNWIKQELALPDHIKGSYQSTVWPPFFFLQNNMDGFLPVDFTTSTSSAPTRVFYRTNDSGLTWEKGGEIPEGAAYYFLDAQTGWAWGEHTLYTTTDGAKTWQAKPVAFSRSERANIINFIDLKNGWLITVDAKNTLRMYRTSDGGATWAAIIH